MYKLTVLALFLAISCAQERNQPSEVADVPAPSGWEVGGGGDVYSGEFVHIAHEIAEVLKVKPLAGVSVDEFLRAIKSTKVVSKEALTLDGLPVDAINYPKSEPPLIVVSQKGWNRIENNRLDKVALVLHEYLGILGIKDDKYQISRSLDAPEVFGFLRHPYGHELAGKFKVCKSRKGVMIKTASLFTSESESWEPVAPFPKEDRLLLCLNLTHPSPAVPAELERFRFVYLGGFGFEALPQGFFQSLHQTEMLQMEMVAPLRPSQYREINESTLQTVIFQDGFYYTGYQRLPLLEQGAQVLSNYNCEVKLKPFQGPMGNEFSMSPGVFCTRRSSTN